MLEQEVQQVEATEGETPTEGQPEVKAEAPNPNLEELKSNSENWKNLEAFCRSYPAAGQEINQLINDYMSGNVSKKETVAAIQEVKKEAENKESGDSKSQHFEQKLSEIEVRLRKNEEAAVKQEMDLALKKLANKPEFGPELLKRQADIEKKVMELGLVPALTAGSMSVERAYEIAATMIEFPNQLTKGKNEVISEIESKRAVQGPQISKTSSENVIPARSKSLREALESAEKEKGYTLEDAREAVRRG